MQLFFTFYFFILGSVLGSFFNVVGLRVPKQELFKQHRSYCPHCLKTLVWYEMIPIVSFFLLKGRCRHCQKSISSLYPVMETTSGMTFAFSYWYVGMNIDLIVAFLLLSLFHIIIVSDLTYLLIPDRVLLFFFLLFIPFVLFNPHESLLSSIIGGFLGFGGSSLIILMSRGGMGGGDMKLFALLGFVLGWQSLLLTLFLSAFIGALVGGVLLQFRVISRKDPIPFGPFIVTSASVVFFSGEMVVDWYIRSFFIVGVV